MGNQVTPLRTFATLCVLIGMIAATDVASLVAESRATSRLARILVGRNEGIRQQRIGALARDVARRIDVMEDLIYAVGYHADAVADGKQLPPSFAGLVDVITQINRPEAKQAVIDLLDCTDPGVALIAADALGRHKIYEAIDPLKNQVKREDFDSMYGFRFSLVRALVQMEHPDSLEFLGQLSKKLDGQLKHELDQQLKKIDVDDFRGDQVRFAAWNESRTPKLFKTASDSSSYDRIKLARNQYYGIDINAKRMLFILDQSGSMAEWASSGTRLIQAKRQLMDAIHGLPENAEFGILFFDEVVRPWREKIVYATDENKKEAIQYIGKVDAGKRTNTYGALRKALEFDDQLETVFLLTDGKPTAGKILAHGAIVQDILRRNQQRHLTINTIGISVEGKTEAFLRMLSEKTNGEFRFPR